MLGYVEAELAGDIGDCVLQRGVLEGHHAAAVATDGVMMMVAVGLDALVADHSASDLDAQNQAELLELLERPVNARTPNPGATLAQFVVEIQSRDRAIVAGKRFDNGCPGAPSAVAGLPQDGERVLRPGGVGRGCHLRRS